MVESEVAVPIALHGRSGIFDAQLLITPPLTLTTSSMGLIFVAVVLTLLGILLFHRMVKSGSERWNSPTLPLICCLLMIVISLIAAMLLSLAE